MWYKKIFENLALCFGGHSQYNQAHIVDACFGHANNNFNYLVNDRVFEILCKKVFNLYDCRREDFGDYEPTDRKKEIKKIRKLREILK